jgi:nucleotide-binding universal stress UspA family protein
MVLTRLTVKGSNYNVSIQYHLMKHHISYLRLIGTLLAFEKRHLHNTSLSKGRNMKSIHRILVALDFSQFSKYILEYAVNLAEPLHADLVLANVINQRDIDIVSRLSLNIQLNAQEYIDQTRNERLQAMDAMMQDYQTAHLKYQKIIKTGTPFVELVQAITETESDLAIMGSKGRGNIAGVLFGSTAEKLFRRSPVPLLSLRVG